MLAKLAYAAERQAAQRGHVGQGGPPAYQADPALASMRLDFAATLREVLEVLIAGLLARSSRSLPDD